MQIKPLVFTFSLLLGWCIPDTTRAAELSAPGFELCGEPPATTSPHEDKAAVPHDETTILEADEAKITGETLFNFSGDVSVRRADQQLQADTAVYDRTEDAVEAKGNVHYEQGGLSLEASSAKVDLDTRKGEIEKPSYRLSNRHARGDAEHITLEGPGQERLKGARFTTCNPGEDDWYLNSSDIKLDRAKGVGTARNLWLELKGVPFFYLPFATFPLNNERKSGFLVPSFGNSDKVGFDLRTPYYWNIAPDRDATLTPRITSKRGLHLLGEFRYLNPTNAGEISIGYLPYDPVFGKDRLGLSYRQHGNFAQHWGTDLNLNYVSDDNYLEDLGNNLSVASTTHLEQRADVTYNGSFWSTLGRVQAFQTVDDLIPEGARPYQRLPQLLLNAHLPQRPHGLNSLFRGEFVNFERSAGVTGERIDLEPSASLPLRGAAGYLTPSLGLRHTRYALANEASGAESDPTRTLPILSLDSGMFLERDISWGKHNLLQTLEPRLYYLYVPFRDQSELPVFDTGLLDFNFTRLFQPNRFSGADRVGDANQVTLAVTTRLVNDDGAELLNGRIGQIRYFSDRRVTLPGVTAGGDNTTDTSSDIIAEASSAALIKNWSANALLQWDPQEERIDKGAIGLRYQPDPDRLLNLAYRFVRDVPEEAALTGQREEIEQTDVAALWPLARNEHRQWNGVARWTYSLAEQRSLETLAGVEYDTCCYAVRVAGRRFVTGEGGDTNNGIFLQLELKGLANLGTKGKRGLESLLDTAILDDPRY